MLTMADINTIKNLRNNHDKSINEIATTLDINWRTADRKSVVQGKSVDLGGRRIIKKIFFKQKTAYEIFESVTGVQTCALPIWLIFHQMLQNMITINYILLVMCHII